MGRKALSRTSLFIPVIAGSSRLGRQSIHAARVVVERLALRDGVATGLIDLAHEPFPIMEERLSQAERPPASLVAFSDAIVRADGLVIVTPEYKGGVPGVLKNALDYLDAGIFRRKPIAIATVSSGGFGGLSCLAQLRLVCLAMGGLPIPVVFPISKVQDQFDEQGALTDPGLITRLGPFLDELEWYTRAMADRRAIAP